MYKSLKKKAFTMMELMIVIAIIAILAALLIPKAKIHYEESRRVGVDRNRTLLETIVRNEYEKPTSTKETEEETIDRIYEILNKNQDLKSMRNPFNKKHKEVGFIKGNTITNKDKAGYVFTEEPDKEDLSKGNVYVVIKDNQITSNTGEGTTEKPQKLIMVTLTEDTDYKLAIGSDNNLYAWGKNYYGQLGTGDKNDREEPTLINLPNNTKPKSISIGFYNSMVIGNDGNLYTWGYNSTGVLGTGDTNNKSTPTLINLPNGVKVKSVTSIHEHTLAIGEDGELYAWGRNESGQLGTGGTIDELTPTLITLPNTTKPKSIAVGQYHSLAIGNDGNLYAWGYNAGGHLGTGDKVDRLVPTLITLPNNTKPISIIGGPQHSMVIGDDGNLYTWGWNDHGQLGKGDKTDRNIPTLVTLPNNAKPMSISLGFYHSLAIGDDGNLYAWGNNDYRQLGTGDTISKTSPTLITLPNGAKPKSISVPTSLSVESKYTEVITTNGDVIILGTKE